MLIKKVGAEVMEYEAIKIRISYVGLFFAIIYEFGYLLVMNYHIHNTSYLTTTILMLFTLVHILGFYLTITINFPLII